MSAINETEPGGELVCLLKFSARARDLENKPLASERRTFSVGERVRYLSHFYERTPEDNPIGLMAIFEPLDGTDGKRYAATQDYFVTIDCWEGLKDYFTSRLAVVERDMMTKEFTGSSYLLVKTKPTKSVRRA